MTVFEFGVSALAIAGLLLAAFAIRQNRKTHWLLARTENQLTIERAAVAYALRKIEEQKLALRQSQAASCVIRTPAERDEDEGTLAWEQTKIDLHERYCRRTNIHRFPPQNLVVEEITTHG